MLTTTYEKRLVLSYLTNAVRRLHRGSSESRELRGLFEWVSENSRLLPAGSSLVELCKEGARRRKSGGGPSKDQSDALRDRLTTGEHGATRPVRPVRADRLASGLRRLGREINLSRTDLAILEIMLRYRSNPVVEDLLDSVFGRKLAMIFNVRGPALPCLLGISGNTFLARLEPDAPLVKSGLVAVDEDGDVTVIDRLHRLAFGPAGAGAGAHALLFDAAPPGELEWSDFDHIAEARDHVEALLRGAFRTGRKGVNVLVYGEPGTGKTEFCRTLARRLGVPLYTVGESDDDGGEPSRRERLQELRLAQRLLADSAHSLLLFDEMEDLLAHEAPFGWMAFARRRRASLRRASFRAEGSKVYLNRVLEQGPVPILWTTNSAGQTCEAVLRRMMFAVELRQPPSSVRARIWSRQLARHGIESHERDARALAFDYDVTPGVASGVTAAAELVDGGGLDAVRCGVRSLARVLSRERPPQRMPERFDPRLVHADTDLVSLAGRLADGCPGPVSFCLQGPPGTGKSAFVRHLAERMGIEVVQKRASDLMSMWLGDTEKRIAAAFAEARDAGSFLVFDEADSLLADRRFAARSWEVSQVNEMLTWMESHPLPFACTTNFGEHLDPATLRRFVFKVTLDYLSPEQVDAAFHRFFALVPPAGLARLAALTPGDFAVVRRKAAVLGRLDDAQALTAMLRAECDAKPDRSRPIGFCQ